MKLCSENHGEVCYESRNCPACEAIADKDKAISMLEDNISKLESAVESLNSEIASQ